MKLSEFICTKAISCELKASTKKEVIEEMVDLLVKAGAVEKKVRGKLIEVLLNREALGSTALGEGIAIPHGKCEQITKLTGAIGISRKGINFDSLDGEPVFIFFLVASPLDSAGPHLKALQRITKLLQDRYFRENFKSAKDEKVILSILSQDDGQNS